MNNFFQKSSLIGSIHLIFGLLTLRSSLPGSTETQCPIHVSSAQYYKSGPVQSVLLMPLRYFYEFHFFPYRFLFHITHPQNLVKMSLLHLPYVQFSSLLFCISYISASYIIVARLLPLRSSPQTLFLFFRHRALLILLSI